jgi:hypothetical protein
LPKLKVAVLFVNGGIGTQHHAVSTVVRRNRPGSECRSTYPAALMFMWKVSWLKRRIDRDPRPYSDVALTPVRDEYGDRLELFNATESARRAADFAIERAAVRSRSITQSP